MPEQGTEQTGTAIMYTPSAEELQKWENNFIYHPPKGGQLGKYAMLRAEFRNLAMELLTCCPPSRERSLAMTDLESACMWANAAIARNE